MKMTYYCENGAYHQYECCYTCWNKHPIAKKYGDYFNKEARRLINDSKRRAAIKICMKAGFTKKQAEYLERNTGAFFQQIVED